MNDSILVVGAGIIGIASALELQRRGHHVTLVDRHEPARECSFGNAGIIATSESFPLISPARVRQFPKMLLDRDGPAVVRMSSLPALVPWVARAARTLSPKRQASISAALGSLNKRALPAWRDMVRHAGSANLIAERGMIELARDPLQLPHLASRADQLIELGIKARMLSAEEVLELEPALARTCAGGLLHEETAHVTDPHATAIALLWAFEGLGGKFERDRVIRIEPAAESVTVFGDSHPWTADRVVVCAGLSSAGLLRPFDVRAPLQAERGYHLTLPAAKATITRPLTFHAESCVATPMAEGLRLAGTIEFASANAAPDWSRADRLLRYAERYLAAPLPPSGSTRWLGSRPSLPDSLPAIGLLEADSRIAYAFGHQHLGLTQAAISAEIIAVLLSNNTGTLDVTPFRIERFE